MERVYWLPGNRVAGSPRPGHRPGTSSMATRAHWLAEDVAEYKAAGIGALVSLTEEPLDVTVVASAGLQYLHAPIDDMTAPTKEQLAAVLSFIDFQIEKGHAVLVHCLAGQGRTGTVLAAWLISHGDGYRVAIDTVRRACPAAIETKQQEDFLLQLAMTADAKPLSDCVAKPGGKM